MQNYHFCAKNLSRYPELFPPNRISEYFHIFSGLVYAFLKTERCNTYIIKNFKSKSFFFWCLKTFIAIVYFDKKRDVRFPTFMNFSVQQKLSEDSLLMYLLLPLDAHF